MALRIRKSGEILCAAVAEPQDGDTYINDNIHYYMSVLTSAITASPNHKKDSLWHWNIREDMKEHYNDINKWINLE